MDMPSQNPYCNGIIAKSTINGTMYEVMDISKYNLLGASTTNPAVLVNGEYVLPVRSDSLRGYGIAMTDKSPFAIAKLPKEESEEFQNYTTKNKDFFDMRNITSMESYLKTTEMVRGGEVDIVTSPDNIFKPLPTNEDTPAMYALKEATCEKNIDIDKYSMRFGANFNNDKRLFNKNSISINKLTRLCDGLDIKATLVLEDKESTSPNPIGKTISIELTGGDGDEVDGDE